MKKVLLATSILVATTGFAAAEIKLSGDGRMGVVYNGDKANFSSRIRAKFNLSGESDSGLSFGGAFRVDQTDGSGGASAHNGGKGSIFVSGAFGTIEMGDTVGAAEAVLFDLPEIGFTDLDHHAIDGSNGANEGEFLTGDGSDGITKANNPSLLYTYSFNDFTIAASLTDGQKSNPGSAGATADDDQAFGLAASYAYGDYTVGIAYEAIDYAVAGPKNTEALTIGGSANFADTTVYALYTKFKNTNYVGGQKYGFDDVIGLGVKSKFDATTVSAYVKQINFNGPAAAYGNKKQVTTYGIGAAYNLGGGASVVGGIADSSAPNTDAVADLGLKFSF